MKSLSEILGNNDTQDSTQEKKSEDAKVSNAKKKEKKKSIAKAHEHGKVIEIQRDPKEFSNNSDESLLGEEVVLLDMGLTDTSKLFEDQKPANNNNNNKQTRSSKPAAFGNRPQGLKRGKRKKELDNKKKM